MTTRIARTVSAAGAVALLLAMGCAGSSGSADGAGDEGGEPAAPAPAEWVRLGGDLANTRAAVDEAAIGPDNVSELRPAWELTGVNGVSGTPIVADGVVYAGDWTGHVRALDATTGEELWDRDLATHYIGGAVAVDRSRVFVGTFDARVVALDRGNGAPQWETPVGDHPQAVIFGSPIVADGPAGGLVLVGVGSFEVFAGGESPTFRGHVVGLDADTGAEVWRFWVTAGDETEGPGVSIWSSPAIDTERGHLYIGTGQAYALPAPPRSDALLALDVETGAEVWATQFTAGDAWTLARPTGLDADVGAAPNLFEVDGTDAVGVGDKAGAYHALDRDTGEVLWSHKLTEGGLQGGVMASAAVHAGRVYVASNRASQDADLVALDADTGVQVWRVDVGAHVTGPVTWANGLLFVADDSGRVAAYDAADGRSLWSHAVAAPAAGGIAVVDGTAYAGWGWWLASPPPDPQGGLIAFRLGGPGSGAGETGGSEEEATSGEAVYRESCATCHGGSGEGGSGPSLVGVDDRLSRTEHIDIVRDGRGNMPGWDASLSPEEIEAVVDYERSVLSESRG
ncbi:MAG: PQQ-binding-like beta-propeller repeat protein [Acidimicrobiales bacterium]